MFSTFHQDISTISLSTLYISSSHLCHLYAKLPCHHCHPYMLVLAFHACHHQVDLCHFHIITLTFVNNEHTTYKEVNHSIEGIPLTPQRNVATLRWWKYFHSPIGFLVYFDLLQGYDDKVTLKIGLNFQNVKNREYVRVFIGL